MANNANIFALSTTAISVNQGNYGTAQTLGKPIALIATPDTFYLTPTQEAALKATLQAAIVNNTVSSRIQMLGTIVECNLKGGDAKTQSFGYGTEKTITDGQYNWELVFGDDDIKKQATRRKFNGRASDYRWFIVDDKLQLIGTQGDDGSGNIVKVGLSAVDYHAIKTPFNTGDGVKQSASISFANSAELNDENIMVSPMGFNPLTTLKNVADAWISQLNAIASRVVTVSITDKQFGSTDLVANYPSILATAANYVVTDHATGTVLTVSTAARATVSGVDGVTLTMASTSFPTSGGSIDIKLAGVSTLVTAGMKPYESNTLTVPIP